MKNRIMRYLPLLAISLSTMSCSDFLTLKPEYQMNELGFYQNESDFETAVCIPDYRAMVKI